MLSELEQNLIDAVARLEADNRRLRGALLDRGYGISGVDPESDAGITNEVLGEAIRKGGHWHVVDCLKQAVCDKVSGMTAATRWAVLAVLHLEDRVRTLEAEASEAAKRIEQLSSSLEHNGAAADTREGEVKSRFNQLHAEVDCWKAIASARAFLCDPTTARRKADRQKAAVSIEAAERRLQTIRS